MPAKRRIQPCAIWSESTVPVVSKRYTAYRQTDRLTDKQTYRQTDRQTDRQTYRQTDRQTDRFAITKTETRFYKLRIDSVGCE